MQKLAANLTEKMLRRKLISPEQAEWCAYLVECKLEQMLCFSVLIALGCLIAPLWEVLLLNWGVVFLRRKANGLHLHTFWGCMLSSLFCELTALWACEKVTPAVAVLLLTISLLTLCLAAPVNDVNIHFDSDEMQALRGGMQKRLAVYLEKEALRFGDHVLQHTVSVNNDFPEQAWADTLFMAGFFLLRMGVLLKDETLIDDALNQYYWHIKYLQDPESGLYYHGYNNITGDHMSGIKWGRANAWAAYTMAQVGVRLPQCYLYPKFLDVVGSLNDQLAALKLYQTENGLWRTIVDDAASYEEVSASAGIAAAMITKGNPLHIKYINKAIPGMLANVSPDGRVLNVSGGTAVMKDANGYRGISRDWIQGWGQGLALAFFAGVLNYDNVRSDGAL